MIRKLLFCILLIVCLAGITHAGSIQYAPYYHINEIAPHYSTNCSDSQYSTNAADENLVDFVQLDNQCRFRQNATINSIKLPIYDASHIKEMRVTQWRQNGDGTYNLIYISEDFHTSLTNGVNNISINPFEVQRGDYYGYEIANIPPYGTIMAHTNTTGDPSGGYHMYAKYHSGVSQGGSYSLTSSWTLRNVLYVIEFYGDDTPDSIFIGDSIMSGYPGTRSYTESITGSGNSSGIPYNYCIAANLTYQNMGYSGDFSTYVLNRFNRDVIAYQPEKCFLEIGTNDVSGLVPNATIVSNIERMVEMCEENNIIPIVFTLPPTHPNPNTHAGTEPTRDYINTQIIAMKSSHPTMIVYNFADFVGTYRPEGPDGNLWDPSPNLTSDGIHYTVNGYKQIAYNLYDYLHESSNKTVTGLYISNPVPIQYTYINGTTNITLPSYQLSPIHITASQISQKTNIYDVPTDGLVAEYHFEDEINTSLLKDYSVNELNGVVYNRNITTGKHDDAYYFGNTEYSVLPQSQLFNMSNNFTLITYAKLPSQIGSENIIYQAGYGNGYTRPIECYFYNGIPYFASGNGSTGFQQAAYSSALSDNEYHMIAYSVNATKIKIYVDNKSTTSTLLFPITPIPNQNYNIGGRSDGYNAKCPLDSMYIYNRTLTDNEIMNYFYYDPVVNTRFSSDSLNYTENVTNPSNTDLYIYSDSNITTISPNIPNTTNVNGVVVTNYTKTACMNVTVDYSYIDEIYSYNPNYSNNGYTAIIQHIPSTNLNGNLTIVSPFPIKQYYNVSYNNVNGVSNGTITFPVSNPVEGRVYNYNVSIMYANFSTPNTHSTTQQHIQFADSSVPSAISWYWDFENDGKIDSTKRNPVHTYTRAGNYSVNLTVHNEYGNFSTVKTNYITVTAQTPPTTIDEIWNILKHFFFGLSTQEAAS